MASQKLPALTQCMLGNACKRMSPAGTYAAAMNIHGVLFTLALLLLRM